MNIIIDFFKNSFVQNILSGIIGGLIVYYLQNNNQKSKEKREKLEKLKVGNRILKIIDQDFLYKYEPNKISINKIIEEFGQPHSLFKSDEKSKLYIFEFLNAKVLILENLEYSLITSITLFSKLNNKFPVNRRLSFEEDNEIMGNAKISDIIIKNSFYFESYTTQLGYETIIGCWNAYRQTKHLKYFYQIDGKFDNINETKGQIIKQVCITQSNEEYPFFSFYDTFYN